MIGTTISHYTILEKLGEGGMGVVYKARDIKLDRVVALKFLPHHVTPSEVEQARFLQEAKASAALNHPNVCSVIDIQEADGNQFIVMEYLDGVTLRKKIASRGVTSPVALPVDDAISYAIQIGEALHEAHSNGIVHRDIKCENIMVNSRNQVKVTDFGLAKLKGSLKLTKTSSTVGTLGYMAPEQIQGGEVDTRSDIFSFGVVLFEMLTGKMPFRGEHEAAMMYSILNEEPESLLKFKPDLSPELDRIIHRSLEKDPEDRYQSVADMVSELRRLQKASTRVVRPDPTSPSRTNSTIPPAPVAKHRSPVLRWTAIALAVIMVSIAAWVLLDQKPSQKITSMAVLPFVNAGADQSAEYLSDGFTESLINSLSKFPGVKMMSRNSVFRYKGKDVDPQVVGKELNVGAVLLGRIQQNAGALSVSVELVNTTDNSHMWGNQYERNPSEIIALQNEISRELSRQLSISLTGDQEQQMIRSATENTEAYQLYLKGRFYWNKRTTEGFKKAVELFQNAIDKDPGYALAYSGLADCYNLMSSYYILPASDASSKARAAANRAIDLDNTLGEPHTNLASIAMDYDWKFDDAEREFKRAIELNPNYATAHHWYGEFLAAMGRRKEGMAEIGRAIESDPLAPVLYASAAWILYAMGEHQQAITNADRALELDSQFPRAFSLKASVYSRMGKHEEALRYARQAIAASGNGIEYRALLGFVMGRAGMRTEAETTLRGLHEISRNEFVAPVLFAIVYAGLNNDDKVFEWLEKMYEARSGDIVMLNIEPAWDLVRGDPRFTTLTQKVGLPQ
jgi:serine/threonine protein kinase/Flp pilus assembly protein TadD